MPIAATSEQQALADAVRSWATGSGSIAAVRAEEDGSRRDGWAQLARLGFLASALPETAGGGGGTVTDLAVVLEQLAAALVPGPVLTTALAGLVLAAAGTDVASLAAGDVSVGVALVGGSRANRDVLTGTVRPVLGAEPDGRVLLPADDDWFLVDAGAPGAKLLDLPAADFSRGVSELHLDGAAAIRLDGVTTQRVHDLAATLAAAEASGVAAICLKIAADYAKVREQFGRPIGSFQAIKHLCAQMLCLAEVAAAVAWDAAECAGDPAQHPLAAAVAAAIALDAAVDNAKDCIQVLGGIGFTWEHDAHLYLRRALALRAFVGGSARWRERVTSLTAAGARRVLRVDVGDVDRDTVRAQAQAIASATDQRAALVDSGYLVPHWPRPYGVDAPAEVQLVIDEELDRAGVVRPDLVIAGWALPTILHHGTPAQVERFVQPSLRGEITWCQLFSEPGAGSDLASLRTRAERAAGGWRLTGQKVWTSAAHRADWGVCLARTNPDAPKHKGISYFLVDMRSPGIDIRPLREITGEAMFNEVFLDDVFVPDELVVGEIDGGWPLARTTLSHERVAMGRGSSLGADVEELLAHVSLDDPAVAQRVGALISDGLAGSLLDLRTTLRRLGGTPDGATASVRKLVGVSHRQAVAELALELLGADGLVDGAQLREFLRLRCLSIAGGTTQVLLTQAAERLLGLPRN